MSAVPALAPPELKGSGSAVQWARRNLFSSPFNTLLTLLCIAFLAWAIPPVTGWLFVNAVWGHQPVEACDAAICSSTDSRVWNIVCAR